MSTTSTKFLRLVAGWEQLALQELRNCTPPDTHEGIFSNNYIPNLIQCLKLNPRLLELQRSDIDAVYLVNYHTVMNLVHLPDTVAARLAEARAHRDDLLRQNNQAGVAETLETADVADDQDDDESGAAFGHVLFTGSQLEDALDQSFQLLCTLLLRFHAVSSFPESYPPLFDMATSELGSKLHEAIMIGIIHILGDVRTRPNFVRFWNMIKTTFRTIIPQRK
jgi:hypothetical protein